MCRSKNRIYLRTQSYFFMKKFPAFGIYQLLLTSHGSCRQFCCRLFHALEKTLDIDGFVGWVVLMRSTWKIDGLVRKPLWIRHGVVRSFEAIHNFIHGSISRSDYISYPYTSAYVYVCVFIYVCMRTNLQWKYWKEFSSKILDNNIM